MLSMTVVVPIVGIALDLRMVLIVMLLMTHPVQKPLHGNSSSKQIRITFYFSSNVTKYIIRVANFHEN